MKGKILALCDTEEEYAQHMTEFLKGHKELPWVIHTYTEVEGLLELAGREEIELLVIAENAYTEKVQALSQIPTVLLNESGILRWENVRNVSKYQQAEKVFREILQEYAEITEITLPRLSAGSGTRFIGMYSPVRRCLQTSFALTLAQMLAEKHKTLYLNFEHYVGITELLPERQTRDLADLLFFLTSEKERFRLRLQAMLCKKGQMDYIPPMKAGQNLLSITSEEWQELLHQIEELGEYEYVILDLTESMQGLFEILRMCYKVFTLTRTDAVAMSKVTQYEQVLALYQYEDVIGKTYKCSLPRFHRLPEEIEQFTKGDLAEYVRGWMKEVTA